MTEQVLLQNMTETQNTDERGSIRDIPLVPKWQIIKPRFERQSEILLEIATCYASLEMQFDIATGHVNIKSYTAW